MAGVSKKQIEQAKQIDLLTYMQTYEPGAVKKSSANEYCLIEHDSLKISNSKWHWHSRGIGGKDALTFLVKVRGMDFVEAVRTLCDGRSISFSYPQINTKPPPSKPKAKFILPQPYADNFRAFAYLQGRGVDAEIINRCIADKTLYESKKYHNVVFVGKDIDNKPRFACLRSTINNFRQDIEGSDKRFCFSIPASEPGTRFLMIAEAPIDILSLATLRKMDGSGADKYHYLSLGGTSALSVIQYLTDRPEIDHVIVCLDNDAAGRKAHERVKQAIETDENLKNRHISIIVEPAPAGKDFNDTLVAIRDMQKERARPNRARSADISI